MNAAHIHLLLNHFPLATLLFGFIILITAKFLRNETVLKVALGILVIGGFMGAAAFFTGEPAEHFLKELPHFQEKLIQEHEAAGKYGLISTIITAVVAAGGLYFSLKKGSVPKAYLIFILVVNFWALTVIGRTSYLGGMIGHSEIRGEIPRPVE